MRDRAQAVAPFAVLLLLGVLAATATVKYWPRLIAPVSASGLPTVSFSGRRMLLSYPGRRICVRVHSDTNELAAYLVYDTVAQTAAANSNPLLTVQQATDGPASYTVLVELGTDLLAAPGALMRIDALLPGWEPLAVNAPVLARWNQHTRTFEALYARTVRESRARLGEPERAAVQRWVEARRQGQPTRVPPAGAEPAAADIVAVTEFFGVPAEFFMDAVATPHSCVPARERWFGSRSSDRPLSRSQGPGGPDQVWRNTLEAVEYAHRLYSSDKRSYGSLPARLRPPTRLDPGNLSDRLLATYSALLFRDLTDRLGGDTWHAVRVYRAGPDNPNERFDVGVRRVILYVRRCVSQAASLNCRMRVEAQFMSIARSRQPK